MLNNSILSFHSYRKRVDYKPFHARFLARQVLKPECPRRIVLEHRKI